MAFSRSICSYGASRLRRDGVELAMLLQRGLQAPWKISTSQRKASENARGATGITEFLEVHRTVGHAHRR